MPASVTSVEFARATGGLTLKDDAIIDFGLIITCILPGCVVLWGLGHLYPPLEAWISGASMASATVGSFFYVALAAIGTGLTASCVRWLVIDTLHHCTGLRPPDWNYALLAERTAAYHLLTENHYKYYQFYANMVVAIVFAYAAWRGDHSFSEQPLGRAEVISLSLVVVFLAASRDSLSRYYRRAGELLRTEAPPRPKLTLPPKRRK